MDQPAYYLQHRELIEQAIAFVCRRHHLRDEKEDFASYVNLKLLENDSAILRKFRGDSDIKSYLSIVIHRLFQDYRNHKWGKWRNSALARRLGPLAEQLEMLMARDGHSFDQAVGIIQSGQSSVTREDLQAILCQLPMRQKVSMVSEARLQNMAAPDDSEDGLKHREWLLLADRMSDTLSRVMQCLDCEDRVILKMSFWDGLPISGIAGLLNLEQKPLYRRMEKILKKLRKSLTAEGVGPEVLRELAEHPFTSTAPNEENKRAGPSNPM